MLRRPPRRLDGDEGHGEFPLKTALRRRLKMSEVPEVKHYRELLAEYLDERAKTIEHAAAAVSPQAGADEVASWRRAVASVHGDCVARARREVRGDPGVTPQSHAPRQRGARS